VDGLAQQSVGLTYIDVQLNRSADVGGSVFPSPHLGFLLVDCGLEVALVADQQDMSLRGFGPCQFVPLGGDVGKGLGLGQVEHQHHPVAAVEVGRNHRPVFLLACSVPDV